jgi:hypothetical protein
VSVRDTIIISDGGGRVVVVMVVVEPEVCLKMAKGYPVSFSLNSWVMGDSFFDSMLVVTLKSHPVGPLLFVFPKLTTNTFLSVIIAVDVPLIILANNLLGVSFIICVEALHICAIT